MTERLSKIVSELLSTEEVEVMEVRGDGTGSPLKVVIDSEIPISLDVVTRLTRLIRDSEEMEAIFPDGFLLEVTSPGIDAPLTRPFQFKKNIDRKLQIKYLVEQEERDLTAKLTGVEETGIQVISKKDELFIPFTQIIQANIIISFKG